MASVPSAEEGAGGARSHLAQVTEQVGVVSGAQALTGGPTGVPASRPAFGTPTAPHP